MVSNNFLKTYQIRGSNPEFFNSNTFKFSSASSAQDGNSISNSFKQSKAISLKEYNASLIELERYLICTDVLLQTE
jgi:hypothetical protein|tara:strand:+ start:7745 stop:7972 length:228 start_codon:yes stop_codon:yes gene_type:complete